MEQCKRCGNYSGIIFRGPGGWACTDCMDEWKDASDFAGIENGVTCVVAVDGEAVRYFYTPCGDDEGFSREGAGADDEIEFQNVSDDTALEELGQRLFAEAKKWKEEEEKAEALEEE